MIFSMRAGSSASAVWITPSSFILSVRVARGCLQPGKGYREIGLDGLKAEFELFKMVADTLMILLKLKSALYSFDRDRVFLRAETRWFAHPPNRLCLLWMAKNQIRHPRSASFCTCVVCTWLASRIRMVLSLEMIPVVYDSMYLLNEISAVVFLLLK